MVVVARLVAGMRDKAGESASFPVGVISPADVTRTCGAQVLAITWHHQQINMAAEVQKQNGRNACCGGRYIILLVVLT